MSSSSSSSKKFDLEERLVACAEEITFFVEKLPQTYTCEYYSKQLTRSSGSTALNFGESQGTVTNKDYVHKVSLSVKELKESRVALKILRYVKVYDEVV